MTLFDVKRVREDSENQWKLCAQKNKRGGSKWFNIILSEGYKKHWFMFCGWVQCARSQRKPFPVFQSKLFVVEFCMRFAYSSLSQSQVTGPFFHFDEYRLSKFLLGEWEIVSRGRRNWLLSKKVERIFHPKKREVKKETRRSLRVNKIFLGNLLLFVGTTFSGRFMTNVEFTRSPSPFALITNIHFSSILAYLSFRKVYRLTWT